MHAVGCRLHGDTYGESTVMFHMYRCGGLLATAGNFVGEGKREGEREGKKRDMGIHVCVTCFHDKVVIDEVTCVY